MPTPPSFNPKFADWLRFKTFGESELEKVVAACHEWASAVRDGSSPRWLSLIGRSGTGKTHCAERLWRWALPRFNFSATRFQPRKIYWPDFVQRLRAGDWFNLRTDLKTWPVVFLDDIGAERDTTGFASEELNTLLGCRAGRWTLLTSNLDLAGLKAVDQRIASRVFRGENICVGINTKDYSNR